MRSELAELYTRLSSHPRPHEPGAPAPGEARVRAVLKDFYRRLAADVMVGFFFVGRDLDRIADKQADFLLRAMGARTTYEGRAPAQAHEQLPPILPGHFDRRLRVLETTLADHGLAAEDIRIWIAFEAAYRDAIVTRS